MLYEHLYFDGVLSLSEEQEPRADVNGDFRVSVKDLNFIWGYIYGDIATFPVCASTEFAVSSSQSCPERCDPGEIRCTSPSSATYQKCGYSPQYGCYTWSKYYFDCPSDKPVCDSDINQCVERTTQTIT